MAEWNTRRDAHGGPDGMLSFDGFYGDYELVINGHSYPLTLVKGTTEYVLNIPEPNAADFNVDDTVDGLDLVAWKTNFGVGELRRTPRATPTATTTSTAATFSLAAELRRGRAAGRGVRNRRAGARRRPAFSVGHWQHRRRAAYNAVSPAQPQGPGGELAGLNRIRSSRRLRFARWRGGGSRPAKGFTWNYHMPRRQPQSRTAWRPRRCFAQRLAPGERTRCDVSGDRSR